MRRLADIVLLLSFLMIYLMPGSGLSIQPDLAGGSLRLDPRVLEDTAGGKSGAFLVVLRWQADTLMAAARATNRSQQGRLIFNALRQAADASQPAVIEQLKALDAQYRPYYITNMLAVQGTRQVVEAMAARRDVQAIESDRPFRLPLEKPEALTPGAGTGVEWNLSWIHAPLVWDLGFRGQGMVYANADTGVQWDHPALKPHYRGWNGKQVDHNYNWWDAIHSDFSGQGSACGFNSPTPCDDFGHGTHTLGIGVGDDGNGNQVGVAPGAKWIACRNMEDGVGRPSTYIECMQFFLAPWDLQQKNPDPDKRPDVVGNSYGCPPEEGCQPHSLQAAMQNLRNAGVFMAVSAGNYGASCASVKDPPALEDSAITVGATGSMTNTIAGLSSRGPVTIDGSGLRKPDLVAPGVGVRSSVLGNGYAALSGTSMAAPHVAGAVALLWSAFPGLRRDVDSTEVLLEQSAVHLTTTQGCGGDGDRLVPNNVYGYGQLDVLAAYQAAGRGMPTSTPPAPTVTPTPAPERPYKFYLMLVIDRKP